jgi:hypothetical protein
MDWQQVVSLMIVGVTAGVLVWSRARSRKFQFHKDAGCGCCVAHREIPSYSVIFQGRKGERPRVIVKMK